MASTAFNTIAFHSFFVSLKLCNTYPSLSSTGAFSKNYWIRFLITLSRLESTVVRSPFEYQIEVLNLAIPLTINLSN